MDLGIFDHLDRREAPLDEFYESRLRLLEKYGAAGFYSCHLAEHHATPLGLAPVPGIFLAAATQRTRRIQLAPLQQHGGRRCRQQLIGAGSAFGLRHLLGGLGARLA